jgi:hypothetical protein
MPELITVFPGMGFALAAGGSSGALGGNPLGVAADGQQQGNA